MREHKGKVLAFCILFFGLIFFIYFSKKGNPVVPPLTHYGQVTDTYPASNYTVTKEDGNIYNIIPPFQFLDEDSNFLTEKDFEDNIYVADFFFTSCPGPCPILTKHMKLVQERLKEEDGLMFLSHSIDPQNDTPSVLTAYAKKKGAEKDNWKFATGYSDLDFKAFVEKSYLVSVHAGAPGSAEMYDHTTKFILVDRDRIVRGFYDGLDQFSLDKLIHDILILQMEYGTRKDLKYIPKPKKTN